MKITALLGVLLVISVGLLAQDQAPAPPPPPPGQTLTPDQLDDLVAPIALYPDPLLSQVLVASTYPLELVQVSQWLQRNPGLTGPDLTTAAQQQNWDPSVQALVVFPDVLKRLNDDISWTTNLGNAFLAQQQDVMDAVQRMRQQAQQAGKLASTPQENVVTGNEGGQPYIGIEPANPDVIYVPVYDPAWIWGPPLWYPYPRWYWPPRSVIYGGIGFGFGGGINVGLQRRALSFGSGEQLLQIGDYRNEQYPVFRQRVLKLLSGHPISAVKKRLFTLIEDHFKIDTVPVPLQLQSTARQGHDTRGGTRRRKDVVDEVHRVANQFLVDHARVVAVPIGRESQQIDKSLHERVKPRRKWLSEILPLNRVRLATRVVRALQNDLDWLLECADQNTVRAGEMIQVGSRSTGGQKPAFLKREFSGSHSRHDS